MKKYLEYKDEKSNKFWSIEVLSNRYTVCYGKIGTEGKEQIKEFSSEEEAQKEAEKLIASKIKKGYKEQQTDSTKADKSTVESEYSDLLNTKDLHKALCDHFAYLADTPGFEPILSAIMQKAHSVEIEKNNLIVSFPGNDKLTASPPADLSEYKNWPKSFQKCVSVHEFLSFPEEGWAMYLGDAGNFEAEYLEEDESDLLDYTEAENVLCPITDYSDWWLYHPGKKNFSGEDSLCFFSHEGGDVDKPIEYKAGSLFLKMMAESLELEVEFPDNIGKKIDLSDIKIWWKNLSNDWKTAFADCLDIKNSEGLNDKKLKKIVNTKSFYCHDSDLNLENLEPLRILTKLEEINLSRQKGITDLSPLGDLIELEDINISNTQVTNIDCLSNLKHLWRLELVDMPITDIGPLSNLEKLEQLNISNTKVKDLSAISNLPKLESINISNTGVNTLEQLVTLKKLRDINIARTPIKSLEPLSKFKNLGILNMELTKISDLSPLNNVKGIYIIHTQNSEVSFQEIMKFVFHHLDDYTESHLGIDIYSEYLMDNEIFLNELKTIDFELGELAEVLSIWVNDKLIQLIKRDKKELAEKILDAFIDLLPLKQSDFIKENLLANALALLVTSKNDKLSEKIMSSSIVPEKITTGLLAYNLACLYSTRNNKAKLLEFTKKALQLGQEPNRFKEDNDFANYQDDADFIDLINNPQTPGPHEDFKTWWDSLNEDWQDTIKWQMGYPKSLKEISGKITSLEKMNCQEIKSLEPLRYFTGLKSLNTQYCSFTSIDALQYLEKLETLVIQGNMYEPGPTIKSLEPIRKLVNLKFLRVTEQDISDLSPIENLTNLETLNIFSLPINNIDALSNLTNLKTLYIGGKCKIENINALEKCTKLEELNITLKTLKNIEVLRNLTKLTEIQISGSLVEDLDPISNCTELQELSCSSCPITSLKPLEKLTKLKKLDLGTTKVPQEEIKAFIAKNPKCKVEYSLD